MLSVVNFATISMSKADNIVETRSVSSETSSTNKNVTDVEVLDVDSLRQSSIEDVVFEREKNLDRGLKQRHIQMLS